MNISALEIVPTCSNDHLDPTAPIVQTKDFTSVFIAALPSFHLATVWSQVLVLEKKGRSLHVCPRLCHHPCSGLITQVFKDRSNFLLLFFCVIPWICTTCDEKLPQCTGVVKIFHSFGMNWAECRARCRLFSANIWKFSQCLILVFFLLRRPQTYL